MSAFVVDKEHIDVICDMALRGPSGRVINPDNRMSRGYYRSDISGRVEINRSTIDELGGMLIAENVTSVLYRYAGAAEREMIPDWIAEDGYTYRRPAYQLTAVEGLKAIDCFEYQSCEHDGWRESEAKQFCDALRSHLIDALPGMDDAPWSWSAEVIRDSAAVLSQFVPIVQGGN